MLGVCVGECIKKQSDDQLRRDDLGHLLMRENDPMLLSIVREDEVQQQIYLARQDQFLE